MIGTAPRRSGALPGGVRRARAPEGPRWLTACALLALLGPDARAGEQAELDGQVTDAAGAAAAGADLVLTAALGAGWRRVAVADGAGRFQMTAPPGPVRLVVYLGDGAVAARVFELPAGRSFVTVDAEGIGAAVPAPALAEGGLLRPAAASGPGVLLLRGRDLGSLLEALPAGSPGTPLAVGIGLAGSGPGEIDVSFEGLDLRDPVSGAAPLELPLALFGGAMSGHTWYGEGDGGRGGAWLRLRAPDTGPRLSAVAGGAARAAGDGPSGRWLGQGAVGPAFLELRAHSDDHSGPVRLWAAAAPRVGELGLALDGAREDGARRRTVLPAGAGAGGRARGWELAALALGSLVRDDHQRAGPIVPLAARDSERRILAGVRGEVRRPFGRGPDGWELSADGLWTDERQSPRGGDPVSTTGRRLGVSSRLTLGGEVLGQHLVRTAVGIAWARAGRSGPQPSRAADGAARETSASGAYPFAAWDDRFQPGRFVELEVGVTLAGMWASGRSDAVAATGETSLSTEPLIAPRIAVRVHDQASGTGAFVGLGRFATAPPLEGMLTIDESPGGTLTLPHDDAAMGGIEWRGQRAALALTAVERRTRAVIEDRFSLLTGRLLPFNPSDVSRRYRAASLQGTGAWRGVEATAAYTIAELSGNYPGYADPGAGAVRPGATAAFDTPEIQTYRDGPLPLDRRHAARLTLATRGRWRTLLLSAGLVGRLDQGVPTSALARSATSGPGEVFLAPRGSQGRTPWLATADAALSAWRWTGGTRVGLALEAFNLTDARPAIARDEVYADRTVEPMTGTVLGAVRSATGEPVPQRQSFGATTAHADPLLVRLVLSVEM
jgi:hypothetical protein